MNRQPMPTLRQHEQMQRLNLAPYLQQQRELEVERAAQIEAALQVDAFLGRPEFHTRRDTDRPTQWERVHGAMQEEFGELWPLYAMAFAGLCFASAALTGLYFWVQP